MMMMAKIQVTRRQTGDDKQYLYWQEGSTVDKLSRWLQVLGRAKVTRRTDTCIEE